MDAPTEPMPQAGSDRRRILRALHASLAFVLLLVVGFVSRPGLGGRARAVAPRDSGQGIGLRAAPWLHGSPEHLGANAGAILILGPRAGAVYPRATLRALPLLWLGSGLGAWLLGD